MAPPKSSRSSRPAVVAGLIAAVVLVAFTAPFFRRSSGSCRQLDSLPDSISASERELVPDELNAGKKTCRHAIDTSTISLPLSFPGRPKYNRRINRLFNIEDYRGEELFRWMDALGISYSRRRINRKAWEWALGLYALEQTGMLMKDHVGLDLAGGREPIMFYLTWRVKQVYAGDIYGDGGFAMDGTSPKLFLTEPEKFSNIPFERSRLKPIYMNGRNLTFFKDGQLDFIVSFSSIEHFGGEQGASESMAEQARVLRPGGIAVVVTEVFFTGDVANYPDYVFSAPELQTSLIDVAAKHGLHLIEDIDWSLSQATLALAVDMERLEECRDQHPHVVLCNRFGGKKWNCNTSIMLVFQKK